MAWGSGGWGQGSSWQRQTPVSPQQQAFGQALGVATGWNAPALMQNEIDASRLANQLGYGDAQYQLGVGQLQQNTALDRERLGLGRADIGIDQAAIQRQMGVSDQLQGLANQLFGIDLRGLDINQSEINSRLGAANRGADRARYQELSEKTAMGSVGSVMNKRNNAEILAQQHDSWDSFWRDTSSTNLKREQVGVAQQQSDINFKEDKAKLADRAKMLDTQAAKLGIDSKQLEANLSQGLARLGVDRLFGMNDLLDAMQSNDIDRQAIAQQIFREAMGMSQFFEVGGGAMQAPVNPLANNTPAQNEQVTTSARNQLGSMYDSGRMITG